MTLQEVSSQYISQYTTVYHSISQYTTIYHSIPQYTIVYYSIPQYTMLYHSVYSPTCLSIIGGDVTVTRKMCGQELH